LLIIKQANSMNKNEFEGLASVYEQYRPDYPEILFISIREALETHILKLSQNTLFLDIGAGTGISTRLLRNFFDISVPIIGIEPGQDMITRAIAQSKSFDNICYIKGSASSLCFNHQTADLILVAQALQWFDRKEFYAESKRVLKSNGILAIIQNNRYWEESTFLSDYESFLEKYSEGYSRHYRSFDIKQELEESEGFLFLDFHFSFWERRISKEEFLGMAKSSTKYNKAQKKHGEKYIEEKLSELIDRYIDSMGMLNVKYKSELFLAKMI
jgi:ubiquinone/menaquinone biosynthesis C-methylase UbiE